MTDLGDCLRAGKKQPLRAFRVPGTSLKCFMYISSHKPQYSSMKQRLLSSILQIGNGGTKRLSDLLKVMWYFEYMLDAFVLVICARL